MNFRGPLAAALAAVLLGAARPPAPLAAYSAPAGSRPAGASPGRPVDAILPDGRVAAPVGRTILVGTNPLGVAVTPDGRFAIVSNDEQDDRAPSGLPSGSGSIVPGYSLAVVDTTTMRVASVYTTPGETFFEGLVAVADPAQPGRAIVLASSGADNSVRVFDLGSDGSLTPEAKSVLVPGFPAMIDVSADGRTAYVAGNLSGTVTSIDIASRRAIRTRAAGYFPFDVAIANGHAYVTNGGLSRYGASDAPKIQPQFANPTTDEAKSSSLSIFDIGAGGEFDASGNNATLRLDPTPDGSQLIGGARPGSIVARRDGRFAYVAMQNVDRIATVALSNEPKVVAGLDLRLFVNAPYGTQPSAEVLSRDGKRLYVALAGLNAVAVLDARNPPRLHRLGLIPTGWYPSALALSSDGRYLYVVDAKGVDGWGMLQRIDMKTLPLVRVTLSALRYNRNVSLARQNSEVPALRSNRHSSVIDHVVYISIGTGSFDATFGASANENETPNLHALARTYGLADNFYANDMNVDANLAYGLGGTATLYAQRTLHVNTGRSPLDAHGEDPEDYSRAGYFFNELARKALSFRDYGGLLSLSGYEPAARGNDRGSKMPPLGGVYTLDVPGLAALDGHLALDYPGWNPQIANTTRAAAFEADMTQTMASGSEPAFTYIWLPTIAGPAGLADADHALGSIVDFLSHSPTWSSTVVFIVADGVSESTDHVNRARSYALVVSPLAKTGYLGHAHLCVASVVKTEEELLGLPPLALPDLVATDMADFLRASPYPSPYHAI